MKKRIFSLIIAIVMITAVLSSCSDGWKGYRETDLEKFVDVGNYKDVVVYVGKYTEEVTDKEIDEYITSKLKENNERVTVTDRASKKGDYADIAYTVNVGDKVWDALSTNSITLLVDGTDISKHLRGLTEMLVGREAGDKFEFITVFPENYVNPAIENSSELAGKNVTFKVTVNSIIELVTPELTDQIVAEKLSKTAKTIDEYKAEVKETLIADKKESNALNIRKDVWYKVVNDSDVINYPKAPLGEYKEQMLKEVEYNASLYGMTVKEYIAALNITEEELDEQVEELAKSMLKETLVMYYIANAENITVSDEEYANGLTEYYESYKDEFETVEEFENNFGKDQIMQAVLNNKVVEYIFSVSGVSNF